jgi:hypothetical protein
LSLAVTTNDVAAWRKELNPSTRSFEQLFTNVSSTHHMIDKGADLVLWLSFEVFRDDALLHQPWEGTLFVNGLYFAHNKDATPAAANLGGAYGEASNPTPKPIWQRRAR